MSVLDLAFFGLLALIIYLSYRHGRASVDRDLDKYDEKYQKAVIDSTIIWLAKSGFIRHQIDVDGKFTFYKLEGWNAGQENTDSKEEGKEDLLS
jgi:hypothetical protein